MLKVQLPNSQLNYSLDLIHFELDNHYSFFRLNSSENDNINITIPFILDVRNEYLNNDFQCLPFISPVFFKENNIFEVNVADNAVGRIGWIFPIQSLVSTQHTYSNNPHFLRYAFVTFNKLLRGEFFEEDLIITIQDFETEIEITEIYPSDLSVLALSNTKTNLVENFNITNYLHSLYINKFFVCQSLNEINIIEKYSIDFDPVKITISEISKDLQEEIFITALYRDHLKSKNHPLVQFHLLYQIIELLINRVYDCEIKIVINAALESNRAPHDIGNDIKTITPEDYRIKKMISNYGSNKTISGNDLILSCNLLLKHIGKETKFVSDAFYQVRNMLVHNFRKVTEIDPGFELIKDINKDFEVVISQILNNYKEHQKSKNNDLEPLAWLFYQLMQ